mgnify:CR=1 FL=1
MILHLLACTGAKDDLVDYGNISGEVSTDRASGVVDINKGFGFHLNGKALFYFPSDEDATCASVAEYLRDTQVDPHGIWAPGECNLTVVLNPPSDDAYDPAGYSWDNADGDGWFIGHSDLTCALGEGDFEWGTRDSGSNDKDFFWTDVEWGGAPQTWEISISGDGEETDYVVDVDLSELRGSYPGESTGEQVVLDGHVTGQIQAIRCTDLAQAMVFPQ